MGDEETIKEVSEVPEIVESADMKENGTRSGSETGTVETAQNGAEKEQSAAPENGAEEQIRAAQEKTKEYYDRLLRVSAEFENFKKRSAREMESFRKFANDSILKDLLPVVDNMERAIQSSVADDQASDCILRGVDLTLKEILRVLERYGVKPIEAMGKPFDPGVHEAVMQEESEEFPENTVVKEFQRGYMLHDRLLRPAMVVVSKSKQA